MVFTTTEGFLEVAIDIQLYIMMNNTEGFLEAAIKNWFK